MLCMVCKEYNAMEIQTVRISDDKEKYEIVGHIYCTDELFKKIKAIKDLDKKSVKKVLDEIGLEV